MNNINDILERIQSRLTALDISESAASEQAGMSRDAIRSIRRGVSTRGQRGVSSETLAKLAPVLGTSPEWLMTGILPAEADRQPPEPTSPQSTFQDPEPSTVIGADFGLPPTWTFPHDLPVHGTAAGSIIGRVEGILIERDVVDYVRRPPVLMGNREAYAVYVSGDSMSPMHKHGELRLVNPKVRPQIEDSVVVTTRHHDQDPGQAYIKILKKRTPNFLVLEQLNPIATLQIPVQYIVSVHKVLTMDDIFAA